ncbi:hypothetical protein [Helicobacter canis]|uniref:hypothetical protein n=1 Tax=Helicobacter canis TaxID=29419 RepID=UPI0011C03511|nr:hypothetical protein [Helicobacter canis]
MFAWNGNNELGDRNWNIGSHPISSSALAFGLESWIASARLCDRPLVLSPRSPCKATILASKSFRFVLGVESSSVIESTFLLSSRADLSAWRSIKQKSGF